MSIIVVVIEMSEQSLNPFNHIHGPLKSPSRIVATLLADYVANCSSRTRIFPVLQKS